jgi:hypothetical protein
MQLKAVIIVHISKVLIQMNNMIDYKLNRD